MLILDTMRNSSAIFLFDLLRSSLLSLTTCRKERIRSQTVVDPEERDPYSSLPEGLYQEGAGEGGIKCEKSCQ